MNNNMAGNGGAAGGGGGRSLSEMTLENLAFPSSTFSGFNQSLAHTFTHELHTLEFAKMFKAFNFNFT